MPIDPRSLEATTSEGRTGGLIADLLRRVSSLERTVPKSLASKSGLIATNAGVGAPGNNDAVRIPYDGYYLFHYGSSAYSSVGQSCYLNFLIDGTFLDQSVFYFNITYAHLYWARLVRLYVGAGDHTFALRMQNQTMDQNDQWHYSIFTA